MAGVAALADGARVAAVGQITDDVAHIAALTALPADAEKCHGGTGG